VTTPTDAARLHELQEQSSELDARLQRVETLVDELDLVLAGSDSAASPATSPAGETAATNLTLLYPSLEAWVVNHFSRVYVRPLGGVHRWCAQWWQHAEAISRLQALWRTWETLRVEPLGLDTWLRERLDHHLPHLLAATGPFTSCTPDRHVAPRDLATTPATPGWWDTPDNPAATSTRADAPHDTAASGSSVDDDPAAST